MAKKKKVPAKKAAPKKASAKPAAKPKVAKKAAPKKVAKPVKKAAPKKPVPVKAKKAETSVKKVVTKKIAALKNALLGKKKEAPVPKKLEAPKKPAKPESIEVKETKAKKGKEPAATATKTEEKAPEVVLTDAQGRRYCRVKDCDQLSTVDGYCRYHYLLFWKKIQIRKKILSEGKLERYIEELTARYPDKYLDMLRKDLRSEKEFLAAIQELEIDDSSEEGEFEDDSQSFIEEVRGISSESSGRTDDEF